MAAPPLAKEIVVNVLILAAQHQETIPIERERHLTVVFSDSPLHSSPYEQSVNVSSYGTLDTTGDPSLASHQRTIPDEWASSYHSSIGHTGLRTNPSPHHSRFRDGVSKKIGISCRDQPKADETSLPLLASLRYAVRQRPVAQDFPSSSNNLSTRGLYNWEHATDASIPPPTVSTPIVSATNQDPSDSIEAHASHILRRDVGESEVDAPNAYPPQAPQSTWRLAPVSTPSDMLDHFPLASESHRLFRENLLQVMNAIWRRANQKEPDAQLLLQFTAKIEEGHSERYRCLFWADGVMLVFAPSHATASPKDGTRSLSTWS
ncbi:hypothetical protein FRC17_010997 [Serendipita sp. 399]|nr:hypothetical protein FRC17_010997 [Serendipita sp. 399]